jgi:chromosomal replication initiator protein
MKGAATDMSESFLAEMLPLNQRYTFDNFVVADCNRFAHAAAAQVCRNPGKSYNPLFLHAKPGLGKTHLMQAIGHEIRSQRPSLKVVYVSAESFVNQLITAIRENQTAEFRRRYRYVDVWLVDDIQFLTNIDAPASEEEFFHTFNTLCINDKQIVIASDEPPRSLKIVNARLRSRLEMGILADLRTPDIDTRVAILKKKAELEQAQISREILEHIAKKIEANVRVLEGALLKVCAYSFINGVSPTTSLVDELITDYSTNSDVRRISMEEILQCVSERYCKSVEDITGPKLSTDIARPRLVAMYLARELTDLSLEKIGSYFKGRKLGGKDGTTVSYAKVRILQLVAKDEQLLWMLNDMKAALRVG